MSCGIMQLIIKSCMMTTSLILRNQFPMIFNFFSFFVLFVNNEIIDAKSEDKRLLLPLPLLREIIDKYNSIV